MRTVAAVVLALLAACEQSGVQFIVYTPADYGSDGDSEVELPDEVRLFVGIGDENAADLGPEGFAVGNERSGTFWLRDPNSVPDIDRAPISVDSPAQFSFVRDGEVDELGVVVAVGYTAGRPTSSAAVFHAQLGHGAVMQYRMGLNGAADPRTKSLRSRVNQLEVWGANECIYTDNRRDDVDDKGHRVAFIVDSKADRDCDGLDEDDPLECEPDVHLGAGPSRDPSCLYESDPITSVCTVGARRCRDGVGDDGSCSRTRFCASHNLCGVCKNAPAGLPWPCAQDFQAAPANVNTVGSYGIECQFNAAVNSMFSQMCQAPAAVQLVPPPGTTCDDIVVKAIPDPTFSDTFALAGVGNTATVKVTGQGCALTFEPMGHVARSAVTQFHYGALALVGLDQKRGLAVPIHVVVNTSTSATPCAEPPRCTWVDQGPTVNPDACVLAPYGP